MSSKDWEQRYIYTDIHEILFASFAIKIQEWFSWLAEFHTCVKDDAITKWNPELVRKLDKSSSKITCAVDYWIDNILSGFVTEFSIDTFVSYSKAKMIFFKGPRGNFLLSLKMWIKIL